MPKTQKTLNTLERAQRVLVSQGRSKLLATSTMACYVNQLAALCDEKGKVGPDAPEKFMDIWHEHTARLDEQKATDEETEKVTKTPDEVYREKLAEINRMVNEGKMTDEESAKAVDEIQKQLKDAKK